MLTSFVVRDEGIFPGAQRREKYPRPAPRRKFHTVLVGEAGIFVPFCRDGSLRAVLGHLRGDLGRFGRIRGEQGPAGSVYGKNLAVREGCGGEIGPFLVILREFLAFLVVFRFFRAIFGCFRVDFGRFCAVLGERRQSHNVFGLFSGVFEHDRADFGRFGSFFQRSDAIPTVSRTEVRDYPPFSGTRVPPYPPSCRTKVSNTLVLHTVGMPYPRPAQRG